MAKASGWGSEDQRSKSARPDMKKLSADLISEISRLRKEGLSHRQIVSRLNISIGAAFNYSRGIRLRFKQHLFLKRLNYINSLGKIPKEIQVKNAIKAGKTTQSKFISQYSKQKIIKSIRVFFLKHNRVPLKREFIHEKVTRKLFGSWNKAITAAGYKPNPVKFAEKCIANDGHKCDSLAEKIIDDWLFDRKIPHQTKVPYNKNNMTADFKIGDTYIEFFGLKGELEKYDNLVAKKEQLFKKNNLRVIKIYPSDLFPRNKLNEILKF